MIIMLAPKKIAPMMFVHAGIILLLIWFIYKSLAAGVLLTGLTVIIGLLLLGFITMGHVLTPMVTKIFKISYFVDDYKFPPGFDVILRKKGSKFYAAKYLLIKIPEKEELSGSEGYSQEVYIRDFESALSSIDVPVKFSLLVGARDITKYREELQTKVYELSLRIKREMENSEPDVVKVQHLQSEKEKYEFLLKRLASGVKPVAVVFSVVTVASGVSQKEAIDRVKAQAHELKAVVANNLNAELIDLIGEDLELALLWERRLPTSFKEFEDMTE